MKKEIIRIKDEQTGRYFTGFSGIGPKMGGTKEEAKIFTSRIDAIDATKRFPMMVLWDLEIE